MIRKLINPRGRVVDVQDWEVPALLKQGFLHVPADQEGSEYNQVYDKGPDHIPPYVEDTKALKRVLPPTGNTLKVEVV